jgi:hypothetical protein
VQLRIDHSNRQFVPCGESDRLTAAAGDHLRSGRALLNEAYDASSLTWHDQVG